MLFVSLRLLSLHKYYIISSFLIYILLFFFLISSDISTPFIMFFSCPSFLPFSYAYRLFLPIPVLFLLQTILSISFYYIITLPLLPHFPFSPSPRLHVLLVHRSSLFICPQHLFRSPSPASTFLMFLWPHAKHIILFAAEMQNSVVTNNRATRSASLWTSSSRSV